MTPRPITTEDIVNNQTIASSHRVGSGATGGRAPLCAVARFGVVAMAVALAVTSLMTLAAEAQMPSTTPGADGETSGTNSSSGAGIYVFAVVLALIVGGAIVLYLRNRKTSP
jgi:preprotein translocase subunit SecY